MEISENKLIEILYNAKNVLLIEPLHKKRKYLPLGLAKIAAFVHDRYGKATFMQADNPDVICITTLFTFESEAVNNAIQEMRFLYPNATIIIGGMYASLFPKNIPEFAYVFKGDSPILDRHIPDYSVNWQLKDPWDKYSFVYTSRGCPNKCAYCVTWRLETNDIIENWRDHIVENKPNVAILDNNLSSKSTEHIKEVINFIHDEKKKAFFANGFDCKYITQDIAEHLAKLKFVRAGLRIAFDRIEEDGVFQNAVEMLTGAGVKGNSIMSFVLFNFKDKPQEANYRMKECVRLGIWPYPQQYEPLNILDRKSRYISKHWTNNLVRAFRCFWLFAGFNRKMSFEQFAKSDKCNVKFNADDWAAWNG